MSGGLIQIVSFGAQDIFLTGNPQITFFKIVYRRYTNFGIDQVDVQFDGIPNFGEFISATLPRNGDLVHKLTLKIGLPEVNIQNSAPENIENQVVFLTSQQNSIQNNFNNFNIYSKFIIDAFHLVNDYLKINFITPLEIGDAIDDYFSNQIDIEEFSRVQTEITNREDIHKTNIQSFIHNIIDENKLTNDEKLNKIQTTIFRVNNTLTFLHKKYLDDLVNINKELSEAIKKQTNNIINFSWIERIGHFIMDYIEVRIADTKIDRHYGIWLDIWYELTSNIYHDTNYNKMIGNIDKLTNYNNEIKSAYNLYVPCQFWFCRNNGLAIPLVAMRYTDITINIQFKDLLDVCYHNYEGNDLENLIHLNNTILIADYIYLDRDERRKFVNSSHEYLIEQTQREIHDTNTKEDIYDMIFEHPCKEMIWVSQSKINLNNNKYHIYSNYINNIDEGNPTQSAVLEFNGVERFHRKEGTYFNYVHPLKYHKRSPRYGINTYSFGLYPEEHQPSGSVNLSMLRSTKLFITFDDEFFNKTVNENEDEILTNVFVHNYNILRVSGGYGGLAFVI
jgi:hypothetical protein